MNFRAPVASRIRGRIRGNSWGQHSTADALRTFASHLDQGADELRKEIKAYERRESERHAAIAANKAADEAARNPLGLGTLPLFR